jgi:hypothetical protein
MRQDEFAHAKEAFEGDREVTRPLLSELEKVARFLIRGAHLPPSYAPYGLWDAEAAQEMAQEWIAEKLLRGSGLAALFDSAATSKAFRSLAQRSLHQFVLNRRERSQSQNLYERARRILDEDERFRVVYPAGRRQDVVWGLAADPPRAAFPGGERELGAFAYSLGEFELIRYKDTAAKLVPLLASEELARFIYGMIAAAGPLSLSSLMQALELRFDLTPVVRVTWRRDAPTSKARSPSICEPSVPMIRPLNNGFATRSMPSRPSGPSWKPVWTPAPRPSASRAR